MSTLMEDDIKRWTVKRKAALVMEIIQGKTTVAEASRSFDLPPSEIEEWVDDAKKGMENALRAKPLDIKENSNQRSLYMKKSRFSESQIVAILKEVELGAKVGETCRKHGVSEPTYYKWKSQFSGMTVSHLAQLRELQDENARLKRMYADLALMHNALKDVVDRKL